jgi:hypothetical protein
MGKIGTAIHVGQTAIDLGRSGHKFAGAASELRAMDRGQVGRNAGHFAYDEGTDMGKTMGKSWLKTFEVIPRLVCRALQFLFAIIACGFYGNRVEADRKAGHDISPEWLLAVTLAGASAITAILFVAVTPLGAIPYIGSRIKLFKVYRAFPWDLILFIIWIAAFGLFADIFLHRPDSGDSYKGSNTRAMKIATWVDLVSAVLWLFSGVYGAVKAFLGDKLDQATDKVGQKMFVRKASSQAKWHGQ